LPIGILSVADGYPYRPRIGRLTEHLAGVFHLTASCHQHNGLGVGVKYPLLERRLESRNVCTRMDCYLIGYDVRAKAVNRSRILLLPEEPMQADDSGPAQPGLPREPSALLANHCPSIKLCLGRGEFGSLSYLG